jgi:hypothetical protein
MRSLSRRSIFAVAGATIVTLLPGAHAAADVKSSSVQLTRSRFLSLVGLPFELEAGDVRSAVSLESIDDLTAGAIGDDLAFGLLFRPETGAEPVAGVQMLRAPGFHPVELFLTAVDRGVGLRLQAIVNRRVPR